ncbi:lysylphosphatidylglycerol synthase transmembrane domain-containing protein [Aureimonas mangrovi]|uniref:lysylphosphatidylglycerol synthase transmembrane domain-containing protein n=1 Tax=Aureimonas mangrovi TaxID=2758041 RepID=UPI00163D7003|nr:lysylphosphatidylglycerol synthase transmembrane domain-containing protein [Aureimonas mangrovi]
MSDRALETTTVTAPRRKRSLLRAARSPRAWLPVLRIVAPILILSLTFIAIDADAALSALRRADILPVLGGLLVMQVQILLSAERWRFTAARLGQRIPRKIAYREYYLTTLVNQVVPGGMGGDALRAARNRTRDEKGKARWGLTVRAIVLERAAGQIAFFAVTAVGLIAWPFVVGRRAPDESTQVLISGLVLVGVLALSAALAAFFGPGRVRAFIKSFGPDLKRAYWQDGAWLIQGLLSVALVFTYVGIFALAALAIGRPVPAVAWITVIPLALLTMLVPVSISGWGLREAVAAALWPLILLPSSAGVASAVLYGLISLAGALPGLLALRRKRA